MPNQTQAQKERAVWNAGETSAPGYTQVRYFGEEPAEVTFYHDLDSARARTDGVTVSFAPNETKSLPSDVAYGLWFARGEGVTNPLLFEHAWIKSVRGAIGFPSDRSAVRVVGSRSRDVEGSASHYVHIPEGGVALPKFFANEAMARYPDQFEIQRV